MSDRRYSAIFQWGRDHGWFVSTAQARSLLQTLGLEGEDVSRKHGRHEKDGGGEHESPKGDRSVNTSDPKTCAHKGHSKTAVAPGRGGGFSRHCGSCGTTWWTPS